MAGKKSMSPDTSERELDALRERLAESGRMVGVTPDVTSPTLSGRRRLSTASLRARSQRRSDVGEGIMTLILDPDGVLRWHVGSAVQSAIGAGRSRRSFSIRRAPRRGAPLTGEVVDQYTFDRLGLSDVTRYLSDWDARLTPSQGLWEWKKGGSLAPIVRSAGKSGRVLLLVHGTFSNCQNLGIALEQSIDGDGISFLDWARGKYDSILAYNHPTLSVSPLLNALRLESLLADIPGVIDIVCHSRGGLVARWWYEVFCSKSSCRGKVVFIGSPLAGTSLAAPDRIRSAIDYLTNVGRAIGAIAGIGANLVPFLSVAQGLMSLVCSATGVLSKSSVADAFVGLVPGLMSQSRVSNNLEMVELRRRAMPMVDYYSVASDFRPKDPGWHFWRHFTKSQLASRGAGLIFPRSHDLVVDHEAMTELGQGLTISDMKTGNQRKRVLDLGQNDVVHHVNYFEQSEVVRFMKNALS